MDEDKASTTFISSHAPKVVLITGLVFFSVPTSPSPPNFLPPFWRQRSEGVLKRTRLHFLPFF